MAFLAFLAISPSILAYSGTERPTDKNIDKGDKQWGDLESLKYYDADDMYIKGKNGDPWYLSFIILKVEFKTDITNVGDENIFVIRFKFFGGGTLQIKVYYTDGTYTPYSETQQSTYLTKGYNIADNKVVDYIKFHSCEFLVPGKLYLDIVNVIY